MQKAISDFFFFAFLSLRTKRLNKDDQELKIIGMTTTSYQIFETRRQKLLR